MKRIILLFLVFCSILPQWANAASCSKGANCRVCSNCTSCAHCSKGGSCSVCRPDLWSREAALEHLRAGGGMFKKGEPYKRRSAPSKPKPVYATPRSTGPTGHNPSIDVDMDQPEQPKKTAAKKTSIDVPKEFSARCVGVTDGDTIRVLFVRGQTKSEIKIRLFGIDAPESKQAFGTQSKKALSDLTFGKDLKIYSKGRDRYGRLLAWLFDGNTSINSEMVKSGFAWWYEQYAPKETKLGELEASAREAKAGLWDDAAPVAPWDFRKDK